MCVSASVCVCMCVQVCPCLYVYVCVCVCVCVCVQERVVGGERKSDSYVESERGDSQNERASQMRHERERETKRKTERAHPKKLSTVLFW